MNTEQRVCPIENSPPLRDINNEIFNCRSNNNMLFYCLYTYVLDNSKDRIPDNMSAETEHKDSANCGKIPATELQLRREIQTQDIVNKLLQASLEDLSLEKTLERAIDCIVSAPLFPMKSKGSIFLVEKLL